MRYIYKTVSLEQFLKDNKDNRIGLFTASTQLGYSTQASIAIESLINLYAKDGWEYVRSEEFRADFFKSTFKSIVSDDANPRLQMFIFRQEDSPEQREMLLKDREKEATAQLAKAEASGAKINDDGTWVCPKSGHSNPMPIGECRYCGFDAT
jgi:hypothetical protein